MASKNKIDLSASSTDDTVLAASDPASSLSHTVVAQSGLSATLPRSLYAGSRLDPTLLAQAEQQISYDWAIGDLILDLYQVTELLGAGGMGKVYKVRHQGWQLDLVVKSPRSEIFAQLGGKQNFINEAETWVNLCLHPHIVSCYYVRTLGGIPRVFAEYVEGGSLSDWIRNGRLYEGGKEAALERILDIAIQFAWGLHYAHEQGLVHQDIKPANLMLTRDGQAKVTDFGLAKARGIVERRDRPQASENMVSVVGMTPAYCSPEQASGQPLSHKTDIWSWGLSILEMFNGEVNWLAGQVAAEALQNYLETGSESQLIPQMPNSIAQLLQDCFQKDIALRPLNMLAVAAVLQSSYQEITGKTYFRTLPKAGRGTADSLNNRALSYLDLGKEAEAQTAWQQACQVDPQHLETIYNSGVIQWRRGEILYETLVQKLQSARTVNNDPWQAKFLLGLVHLEWGEKYKAASLLEEAARQAPNESETLYYLQQARASDNTKSRCVKTFKAHKQATTTVHISTDGNYAISGSADRTLRVWEMATGRCQRSFGSSSQLPSILWIGLTLICIISLAIPAISLMSRHIKLLGVGYLLWLLVLATIGLGLWISYRAYHYFLDKYLRKGHVDTITAACLSSDGKLALSGGKDNIIRLWEVATGRCIHTLQTHEGSIGSVCLSNDQYLALLLQDNILRLWDVTNSQLLQTFKGHTQVVTCASLSSDGRFAISGGVDKTVRIWDTYQGHCVNTLEAHNQAITLVCLSIDGRFALSGSTADKTLRLWEVATSRCLSIIEGFTKAVTSAYLSADGHFALLGGEDGELSFWELSSASAAICPLQISRLRTPGELLQAENRVEQLLKKSAEAYRQGRLDTALAMVEAAREIPGFERAQQNLDEWAKLSLFCKRLGLRTAWLAKTFEGHLNPIAAVSLSLDGRFLLSGSAAQRRAVSWWSKLKPVLRIAQILLIFMLAWLVWLVFTTALKGTVLGFNSLFAYIGQIFSLAMLLLLTIIMSKHLNKTETETGAELNGSSTRGAEKPEKILRLWELATGNNWPISGCQEETLSIHISSDAAFALSGSDNNVMRLWELSTGRCYAAFHGHSGAVTAVWLSNDWRFALSGSTDQTLRLWEVAAAKGRCLRIFEGHMERINSVCLSLDGRLALSGSNDQSVQLWDVATGHCLQILEGHTGSVNSVCLSADNSFAFSGSEDRTIKMWELTNGRCLRSFTGHKGSVLSIALSADGRFILSGSVDKTTRLWEIANGRCLKVLAGHTSAVTSVCLSADGRFALSSSDDKTIRVWELDWKLAAREMANWHEGARPYLKNFLTLRTPYTADLPYQQPSKIELQYALTRQGTPYWQEADFHHLLWQLQCAGYGWLKPEGVYQELIKMAEKWHEPLALPENIITTDIGKFRLKKRLFSRQALASAAAFLLLTLFAGFYWMSINQPLELNDKSWPRYYPSDGSLSLRSPCKMDVRNMPISTQDRYLIFQDKLYTCGGDGFEVRVEKLQCTDSFLPDYERKGVFDSVKDQQLTTQRAAMEQEAYRYAIYRVSASIRKTPGVTDLKLSSRLYPRLELLTVAHEPGRWLTGDFNLNGVPKTVTGFVAIESSRIWTIFTIYDRGNLNAGIAANIVLASTEFKLQPQQ
ncbi:MAG: protein kinase [Acidobacteriota bacterium]